MKMVLKIPLLNFIPLYFKLMVQFVQVIGHRGHNVSACLTWELTKKQLS